MDNFQNSKVRHSVDPLPGEATITGKLIKQPLNSLEIVLMTYSNEETSIQENIVNLNRNSKSPLALKVAKNHLSHNLLPFSFPTSTGKGLWPES